MKKIWYTFKKWFQTREIGQKYFITMVLLSILPLTILGYLSFNIAKSTLVDNQMQSAKDILKTSSESADLLLKNIVNMERVIVWNSDIQTELKSSLANYSSKETHIDIKTIKSMENLINSYFIDTQDIDSICIFDAYHRSVCYGDPESTGKYDNGGIFREIVNEDWYNKSDAAQGKTVFFSENVLVGDESVDTFSSVKQLRESDQLFNQQVLGMLVVNVRKSLFSKTFNDSKNSKFIIFDDSQDRVRAMYSYPEVNRLREGHWDNIGKAIEHFTEKGYVSNLYRNQTTGWVFVHITDEQGLLSQSSDIGKITILLVFLMAVLSFTLSFIFSGKLNKPLRQLKKLTTDWTNSALGGNELKRKDEISIIGENFKKAISENRHLNDQLIRYQLIKKESELKILQAQIKPHFLYNTLESIYWLAIIESNDNIAKMTQALSETFKLSLNNGKDLIPIAKELSHIKSYLTIQNIRYNDKFQYVEQVEPALLERQMLKLLLQPIVENAVYHGLEPKVGPGTIWLTGEKTGSEIVFTIKDDGVGIKDIESTKKGFGLKNVEERLKLYYGVESSLRITSDIGTKVEIRYRESGR
ncbi:two-component system sensor histidine kinase YesM [Lederbergia galactosidilyticus]|uniref:cache domain-containing sensor histidine kinase n=1 Tax=Lederbergia galactosidilytica TaxID=217031 RepID=UPI001AE8A080|nr:histidine kinase [Lederbergia galactosidilytica]MBP1913976.1 two-component system sensor histidine kinase YesM [Lederbergia galactosidilytica]